MTVFFFNFILCRKVYRSVQTVNSKKGEINTQNNSNTNHNGKHTYATDIYSNTLN